jgi:hypothetical protein
VFTGTVFAYHAHEYVVLSSTKIHGTVGERGGSWMCNPWMCNHPTMMALPFIFVIRMHYLKHSLPLVGDFISTSGNIEVYCTLTTSILFFFQNKYNLRKLTTWEQMLLTLVRLKRKPSIVMLADLFDIAPGTASRIFITWILFLEKELSFLLSFPTLAELEDIDCPGSMRQVENLRAIIDCTEFHIEKPFRISSQRTTYSSYKSRNTFKLFISISPVPHINFVSNLYSGSISEKELTKQCGFLELLNPGDVIMADKGFNVQDILALSPHHEQMQSVFQGNNNDSENC